VKVLFIHEVGYLSKPLFEMHDFPELLALDGHEVTFLDFGEKGMLRSPLPKWVSGRMHKEAKVRLIHANPIGNGMFARLVTAFFSPCIILAVVRRFRPDIVVTYAVPTLGWQAAFVCRAIDLPIIFRSIDVSHELRPGWHSWLVRWAERQLLRSVNGVSTHNAYLQQRHARELTASEVTVSLHLPPMAVMAKHSGNRVEMRAALGYSPEDFVAVFIGTFYEFSGVLDLAQRFAQTSRPNLKLLLIGDGALGGPVTDLVQNCNAGCQVQYLGFVKYDQIWDYLSIADLGVNPFEKTLITDAALPNKILQYLAAGLPVVSSELEGAKGVIGEDNGVVWCSDRVEMMQQIEWLSNNKARKMGLAAEGTRFISACFINESGKSRQLEEFEDYLHQVAGLVRN